MLYNVSFSDNKLATVNSWVDNFNSDFKFSLNDKIEIYENSFQDNLFEEVNNTDFEDLRNELQSISNSEDYIDDRGIGNFIFFISAISYNLNKDGATGNIVLSKFIPE